MRTASNRFVLSGALLLVGVGVVLFLALASSKPRAGARAGVTLSDQPLAASRTELLGLAFDAATALPVDPHIKDRSRAQEAVVAACLELDQPLRALGFLENIANWRRGACTADLAFHCARKGVTGEVASYLEKARQISEETARDENSQAWRRDRIRARIARTHAWLGQTEQARELERGLEESEKGAVQAVRAQLIDAGAFDVELAHLDRLVTSGSFEQIRGQVGVCARLFSRVYDDESRRSRLEQGIKASLDRFPASVRIETHAELAGLALDHQDPKKALSLLEEAQGLLEGAKWTPEDRILLMARLARLRHRAGDLEGARRQADAALAQLDAELDRIDARNRPAALRALAEAWQSLGAREAALSAYRRAVEEGAANPNARPRALELSATCCSMALRAFEPDAGLRTRMLELLRGLGPPW